MKTNDFLDLVEWVQTVLFETYEETLLGVGGDTIFNWYIIILFVF